MKKRLFLFFIFMYLSARACDYHWDYSADGCRPVPQMLSLEESRQSIARLRSELDVRMSPVLVGLTGLHILRHQDAGLKSKQEKADFVLNKISKTIAVRGVPAGMRGHYSELLAKACALADLQTSANVVCCTIERLVVSRSTLCEGDFGGSDSTHPICLRLTEEIIQKCLLTSQDYLCLIRSLVHISKASLHRDKAVDLIKEIIRFEPEVLNDDGVRTDIIKFDSPRLRQLIKDNEGKTL